MKKIHSKLKALEWSQHFSHYKSIGIFPNAQGQVTHKSLVCSCWISNPSEIWVSVLPARMKKIQSKMKELEWSQHYSCIDVYSYSCLHPLSNERKSMFKSGDSRAVWTWVCTWKYLNWALHYLHDVIYGKRCGPDRSFRQSFCSRKPCVRLWRCDDVMTFESTQQTPFCLEKSSVRKWTI